MALPEHAEGSWGDVKPRKFLIGGNWKSNGDMKFVSTFPNEVLNVAKFDPKLMDVVVAPTEIHLTEALRNVKNNVHIASQDVSQYGRGAFTGAVTADQIKDLGIKWTLTGHSERRNLFHESDEIVALKTKIALDNNMSVLLCIGELLDERENGKTNEVNARQLAAVAK